MRSVWMLKVKYQTRKPLGWSPHTSRHQGRKKVSLHLLGARISPFPATSHFESDFLLFFSADTTMYDQPGALVEI